ncbi:MAG: Cell division ATP-binding protein FtsE [Parcubacteria group bacterium ADurb.Bin247]|nr:MAG: Cell division ATP-binding protein FtsE [Parcubacteria group bacterium ADurb.Bin247]
MIFFDKVSKIYPAHLNKKENIVFKDIFLRIEKGEFVLITGKSGAGKTTLFRLLIGEEKPTKGKIYFEDKDLSKISHSKIHTIRRKMGIIFQDYKLLSTKNVYENISYIMEALGVPDKDIERNVPELLELVGLESRAYHYPDELSGGEKQRVAIARALVCNPDVILADEPTGNVDPYYTMDIINLLLKINEKGTTVLLATHDKDIVNSLDKRVVTLSDGVIVRDEMGGKFRL